MKRGGPIQRRTPLRAKRPLQQKGRPTTRSAPIRVKRTEPRRRDRTDRHSGISWPDVRLVIYARAGGRCELCGRQLNIVNMEGHHRRTRRLGPDCPGNALALCKDCHHGPEVHGGPEAARELGRIVSRHADDPCSVPVFLPQRGWVLLGCDGGISPTEQP